MTPRRAILVTGANRGIGQAIAARLGRDGFAVVVHCGTDEAAAAATLDGIVRAGGEGRVLRFDIADRAECRARLAEDLAAHGPLYGAVLNAGIVRDAAFPAMEGADWDAVIGANLDGFYNVLHPIVMPMVTARRGGRIVTLSSVAGIMGNRGQTNYGAAKAGIIGATKSLAVELARRNITVNCVAPGLIETRMTAAVPAEEVARAVPMRRMGRPEEVAAVVSFLCGDDAGYVTRQVISVNGGMI